MKNELEILKPIDVPMSKLVEKYQRVKEVSNNFPRVGGGVFQMNAINTVDGYFIQCIFVKRDFLNHKQVPLPDGGQLDIEATKGLDNVVCNNREIQILGRPLEPDPVVVKAISERNIGFVTRERLGKENDFSIETVMGLYTPGSWHTAKDLQYNRQIVLVEISPKGEIKYCNVVAETSEKPSELPLAICSEKVLLAISIAKDICKVLNTE